MLQIRISFLSISTDNEAAQILFPASSSGSNGSLDRIV